ncbi:unnamed protein product [Allacma fusca]|uniref:Protein kinase domain-containing protein n=1 Tax=Allacma fusca TaxID=39272 RepID=A0A8J2JJJ4_9HEXA|nr:unnamed protein product [Allacma fusca]
MQDNSGVEVFEFEYVYSLLRKRISLIRFVTSFQKRFQNSRNCEEDNMKRGPNSSLSNPAKRAKTFEGEELHYTKSGKLDMRYSSSKKYLAVNASFAATTGTPSVKVETRNRGNSLPPVYTRNGWESLNVPETTGQRRRAPENKPKPQVVSPPPQGVVRRNKSGVTTDGEEELHYTKSGRLDMRYSSSRRHLERINASYTAGTSNASAKRDRGPAVHSLPLVNRNRREPLVVGEVTPVDNVEASTLEQSHSSQELTNSPKEEIRAKSPMVIIENDIPSSVPMTRNNVPDMRTKAARDWVEEQAKRHAGLNMPVIPSWIPRQKDGTIDLNKSVVQIYLNVKDQQTPVSVIPMSVYDPDRRAKHYEKKLKKKGNFYRCLKHVLRETVPDLPCILLDNTGIIESLPHKDFDASLVSKSSSLSGGINGGNDFADDEFKIPIYIPKLDYDTLKCTIWNKKENKIGNGAFGVVYKGKHNGEDVAIKKLFLDPISSGDKNSFIKELTILAAFGDHPNLVKLTGYTVDPATIVMEYISRGSLNHLLYFCEDDLTEAKLCDARIKKRIACGIVYGMRQLHSVGIIHGDLKPANVLITDDFSAKITDFGLSRLKVKTTCSIGSHIRDDGENVVAGTASYMAPELLKSPKTVDEKTDVYSFGILLNEIVHEEEPYARDYEQLKGRGPFGAVDYASSGRRPYMNTKLVTGELYIMIISSWNWCPQDRLTFSMIGEVLRRKDLTFPSLIDIPSYFD